MRKPSTLASIFDIFPSIQRISSSSNKQGVLLIAKPGPMDVLCGKDKTYSQHEGNRIYSELIASLSQRYASAHSKQAKMKITKSIVCTMHTKFKSRFLRRATTSTNNNDNNDGGWVEIPDLQARDKTSHALRFCNHHNCKNNSNKTSKRTRNEREEQETTSVVQQPHRVSGVSSSDEKNCDTVLSSSLTVTSVLSCGSSNSTLPCGSIDDFIFQRQQQILRSFMKVPSASRFRNNDDNDGGMFNDDDENMLTVSTTDSLLQLQPKVAVTIQDEVDDEFCKDAFDSLRSEDLYAILAEPFFDSEWDTLMTPID